MAIVPHEELRHAKPSLSAGVQRARIVLGLLQRAVRSGEPAQIAVCAVMGAVVGIVVAGLHKLVDWLHQANFNLPDGHNLSAGIGIDRISLLYIPLLGGLLLGVSAVVARRFRSSEIVDPIEANALHGGHMSMLDSMRLVFSTVVSNASGAAVGMEAGYSQLGASTFALFGRFVRLRRADQRIFVSAGAAAAIAAAFNAPLAGAFYGYELILGNYAIRALAPVTVAALASALTERVLIDPDPLFVVGQSFHFDPSIYVLFAILGLCAAGFSIGAMQMVTWAERTLRNIPLPQWLRPAMGGVLLTAIALFVPQVLGSGHGAIQLVFDSDFTFWTVSILLIAKLLASAVSLGSGFRGGMFSSSLLLGCLFGAVFADVVALVAPPVAEQHAALMMVGMGSVAAAIIGAPLTMVFLILEGTGDFPITVGVTVGVVIASTIVRLSFGYSFSTWRFHQRGLGIRSPHDVGWLADMTVRKLMREDPKTVSADMPLAEVRERFPLGSTKRVFVVKQDGTYCGTLDVAMVHENARETEPEATVAQDLASEDELYLLPYENVRSALARFEDSQTETLPVVRTPANRVIIGYLTEQYALRRYSQELERRRSAELGEQDLFSISDHPR